MKQAKTCKPITASSKRQLEDAAKALHLDESSDFQSIYHYLFDKAIDDGGLTCDGTRSKHPMLSIVRTKNTSQFRPAVDNMDDIITKVCERPEYRRWLKASPTAALASVGAALPASAKELVDAADADANLLNNVAQAQTTVPIDDFAAEPQEGVIAIAIGVTIVLSGVGVAVAVIIRRRRRGGN